jgi:hypothetical protein
MYIANDIDHLLYVVKIFKVHELLPAGGLGISRMRMHKRNLNIRQQVHAYKQIVHLTVNDLEEFEKWRVGKSRHLTTGDLSTIFIALTRPGSTVVVSNEDFLLPEICEQCNVPYRHWSSVVEEVVDEKWWEFYKNYQAL